MAADMDAAELLDFLLLPGFSLATLAGAVDTLAAAVALQPGQVGEPLLHPHDTNIVAVASDARVDTRLPQFLLDDIAAIADFIEQHARPA